VAEKWACKGIGLCAFARSGEQKPNPEIAKELFERVEERLQVAGYTKGG